MQAMLEVLLTCQLLDGQTIQAASAAASLALASAISPALVEAASAAASLALARLLLLSAGGWH
jgi:hypothetical protein